MNDTMVVCVNDWAAPYGIRNGEEYAVINEDAHSYRIRVDDRVVIAHKSRFIRKGE